MLLNLTDLSGEPLHRQISRQIRSRILSGALATGDALPSIRGLARDGRVSVITVQRAYDDLCAEGLVVSHPGKGYFVARNSAMSRRIAARARLEGKLADVLRAACDEGLHEAELRDALGEALKKQLTEKDKGK